jgi:tetratricopeptide (TPR) repeat protein
MGQGELNLPEGFRAETDEDRERLEAQQWAKSYLARSAAEPSYPPGFGPEGPKSLGKVFKDSYTQAGVRLSKTTVGLAKLEHEVGGKFRDWFWSSGAGKALGGKPGFTKQIEGALEDWVETMGAGLEQYIDETSDTQMRLDEDAGFFETTVDLSKNPEKLLQGVLEAVPLMLQAALGTIVAGPGGGIIVMAEGKAGETYMDARAEGTDVIPAFFQAELTGLGEAAIEQWTFGKKIGLAKGFSEMVKKGGKKLLWEAMKAYGRGAVEEGTQTFNENLWRYVFTDREQELFEGVGKAAAIGGPLELVMSGAFSAAGKAKGKADKMLGRDEQHRRLEMYRSAVEANPSLSEESKAELNEEFDQVQADIESGVYSAEEGAAFIEANLLEEEAISQEEYLEQNPEAQEGDYEAYTEQVEAKNNLVKVSDSVVEGQEVEPVSKLMAEEKELTEALQSIEKLNKAIQKKALTTARRLTEEERSLELGKRVGKAKEIRAKALKRDPGNIQAAQEESRAALAGEMPKATFERFTDEEMTSTDFENIRAEILDKLQYFEQDHALEALKKLQVGRVPTESEMKDLGKVIGKEQIDALEEAIKGVKGKAYDFVVNLVNFPTTMLASSEVSMIGRQGLTTLFKWPKKWLNAFGASYAAYFSKDWSNLAQVDMLTRKGAEFGQEMGLFMSELDAGLSKKEERFQSSWAKQIPYMGVLVRASERAAVVGMNKLRTGIWDHVVNQWEGMNYPESEYKRLARIINMSTGRGNITNKTIQGALPILNAAFFSPRYVASRFEMIGSGVYSLVDVATGKARPSSKIMASQMVNFVIAGGIAMAMAIALGATVEKDPHSSDFGKIKLGRTRIDVWGGFQQIVRTAVQLSTGKGKAVSSGEMFTKNRLETFGRFVQSKLAPTPGLFIELASKKTFLGEDLPEFKNKAELMEWAVYEKLTPLVIQDTVDAFRYSESKSATALALPLAFHGIGVQTFDKNALDDLTEIRDHYSMEVFGKQWNNLGPLAQEALRTEKPQIPEQELIAKYERRNATFDVRRQREAGIKVEKSLPREVQDEMDSLNVTLGGLSRTIVRNWRLNGDLYQKYQDNLSGLLGKALPKIVDAPSYKAQRPQDRQKILEWVIKQSKAAIRKQIVMEANMQDIEDISKGVEDE